MQNKVKVKAIPVLTDNYIYLLHDEKSRQTAVIDPAMAEPVLQTCDTLGWNITHILNTHHHPDHTGGNREIKAATGCQIIGYTHDKERIPAIDTVVDENDTVSIGESTARVIATPGHTIGHIAYYFGENKILFCGDTLFSMGCGRLFEGSAEQMWQSLLKLRALPDDTAVYCAHEYTEANGTFCLRFDEANIDLQNRMQKVRALRQKAEPTLPSSIGLEKKTNIFLRSDNTALQKTLHLQDKQAFEVFAFLRQAKDRS